MLGDAHLNECWMRIFMLSRVQRLVIPFSPRTLTTYEAFEEPDRTNEYPPLIERVRIVFNPGSPILSLQSLQLPDVVDDHACLATEDRR